MYIAIVTNDFDNITSSNYTDILNDYDNITSSNLQTMKIILR